MREYTHEEFVNLVLTLKEDELLELSKNYGGYPVLFRMALDERICHIPFIQTGSAIIVVNKNGEILLQERMDNGRFVNNDLFHDRFIIIDRKRLFLCGSSLKDIGNKCFGIYENTDLEYLKRILKIVNN